LAPLPASPATVPLTPRWDLQEIAGRLTELSGLGGSACLTLATSMVFDAQCQGETAAWITGNNSSFFPLDVAAAGVDLEALAVIRVPDASAVARAADKLARSGAFGLLVLDLGAHPRVSAALQARLRGLARKHDTAILCITEKPGKASSLGSLVSLRAEARIRRLDDDSFACELRVLKDKHRGPGWTHTEVCTGPDGLY
jgi:recombination protein RecA